MTELFKCRKAGTQCCAPKSIIHETLDQKLGGEADGDTNHLGGGTTPSLSGLGPPKYGPPSYAAPPPPQGLPPHGYGNPLPGPPPGHPGTISRNDTVLPYRPPLPTRRPAPMPPPLSAHTPPGERVLMLVGHARAPAR